MRWLPGLRRMCRGSMRPMRRMCRRRAMRRCPLRRGSVQMRMEMRCWSCWLRFLRLQLRKLLLALDRLELDLRLLVEAARHAGACPGLSSSGPWGCKTPVIVAGCDRRRSAAGNVRLSGLIAIAIQTRTLIS